MTTKFSPHFTREEWLRSRTATSFGIINLSDRVQDERMRWISVFVLEQVRARFGRPVRITSGYRCPALNDKVSKEPLSAHQFLLEQGKNAQAEGAVDFQIPGVPLVEVFNFIAFDSSLPYDLVILERGPVVDSEGDDCIHYQISAAPRQRALAGLTRGRGPYSTVTQPQELT